MTARIQTYSGLMVDPLHLSIQDIRLEDIAHALSNLCRFTGHVKRFYSVAEHSVWVSRLAMSREGQRYALLHDASEAYLQDIPRPVKHSPEFAFYREAEERATLAVRAAFRLPLTRIDYRHAVHHVFEYDEDEVRFWDDQMLQYEAKLLMDATWVAGVPGLVAGKMGFAHLGCSPEAAKQMFLARASELGIA